MSPVLKSSGETDIAGERVAEVCEHDERERDDDGDRRRPECVEPVVRRPDEDGIPRR